MFPNIFDTILPDFKNLSNELNMIKQNETKRKRIDKENMQIIKSQKKQIKRLKERLSRLETKLLDVKEESNIFSLHIINDLLEIKKHLENYNLTFFGVANN